MTFSASDRTYIGDPNPDFIFGLTNTFSYKGFNQLYISDLQSSQPRPVKELKAFQKVWLKPGESRDVTFNVGKDALSFYDEASHSWIVERGKFAAIVGNSSAASGSVRFTLK